MIPTESLVGDRERIRPAFDDHDAGDKPRIEIVLLAALRRLRTLRDACESRRLRVSREKRQQSPRGI